MPRIDLNEAQIAGLIGKIEAEVEENDPGMFGPFDLCLDCYNAWSFTSDVVHPEYGDYENNYCDWCGNLLQEEDN